jgi:hypothetical protein
VGHPNIAITIDRYGRLMPGSELDAYLEARAPSAGVSA